MKNESVYNRMTNAEKEVAVQLRELGIQWSYEQPVFVWDDEERPRVWTPDFFLTSFGIYLEVCGSQHFDYDYRRRVFDKNGYLVIFIHMFKEKEKWKGHLLNYLQLFITNRYYNIYELLRLQEI